jgi:hypothetical protein
MDVVWLLDGSSGTRTEVISEYETYLGFFYYEREAVEAYTATISMGSNTIRQSLLVFAGEAYSSQLGTYIGFQTANNPSLLTDPAATSNAAFLSFVQPLEAPGGTSNVSGAIHIAREMFLTEENRRPDAQRVVILVTDSWPTNLYGEPRKTDTPDVTEAVNLLKQEDSPLFVFVRVGGTGSYPPDWLVAESDKIVDVPGKESLSVDFVASSFLCFDNYTPSPTSAR